MSDPAPRLSRGTFWAGVALVVAGQAVVGVLVVRGSAARSAAGAPGTAKAVPVPADPSLAARAEPWSTWPLDAAGLALARELGRSASDLRLLADDGGHVPETVVRDLRAGREAGQALARSLGLDDAQGGPLVQAVLSYMIRRVAVRESFRGKHVSEEALDDGVRHDVLKSVEVTFGPKGRDGLAAALPGLPDLTRIAREG